MFIYNKNLISEFGARNRKWQGIPSIERTSQGKIFVTFYSGGEEEQLGNFCILISGYEETNNWTDPTAVAYAGGDARCYDPCIWIDPIGRLWFFWCVQPENFTYCVICNNPDAKDLVWSKPIKIAPGVMMNKPIVRSDGVWFFPIAVWNHGIAAGRERLGSTSETDKGSFVIVSYDQGQSFHKLGFADVPEREFDEHMLLEHKDGTLSMYVRTNYGIGLSRSSDGGANWSAGEDSLLGGPGTRFHIRRLESGNVLLVNHHDFVGRNNLKAMLSKDDGRSFQEMLLIDGRDSVSYPDSTQGDGYIWIVHDRERHGVAEILISKISERDIEAGRIVDSKSYLTQVVSKLR